MDQSLQNIADPALCGWAPAPYLIVSDNIWGDFIYYSHLFPSILILAISLLVFWNNPRGLTNRLLLFVAVIFTSWSLIDLVLWASERSDLIMFFWSILIYFDLLLYIGAFYFIYAFIYDRMPSWKYDAFFALLFIPLFLFAHTNLNLVAFDFTNCWREAFEGPLWQYYVYNVELLIAALILVVGLYGIRRESDSNIRRQHKLALFAVLLMLLTFSIGNIAGTLEVDWEIGQWGLFGVPIFVAILTYLIVKYKSFNANILLAEALVSALCIIVLSMLFAQDIQYARIIAAATLIFILILGYILIRGVHRDVKQREEIEKLAKDLQAANDRLKVLDKMKSEFVSIASHQLRSPITAIRGYVSMLIEGSYGKFPDKAQEVLERIGESSKFMASSIEDYLNVSRIEAGNMKYEMSDFNLKEQAEKIADEMRQVALKKGLVLVFRSDVTGSGMVHADVGKARQVIMNFVDNAIKYTPKGTVTIVAHDDARQKKMWVTISDTGVGMSQETLGEVFDKFVRAKNANQINVTGTGLGLYVAKKMASGMGGKVWAESEGEGKGSTFHLEFPMLPGKASPV